MINIAVQFIFNIISFNVDVVRSNVLVFIDSIRTNQDFTSGFPRRTCRASEGSWKSSWRSPSAEAPDPSLRTGHWAVNKPQMSVCPMFMPRSSRAKMSYMYEERAVLEDVKDMTAWSDTVVVSIERTGEHDRNEREDVKRYPCRRCIRSPFICHKVWVSQVDLT